MRFWQNDRGLLRATAVTRGGTDTEIRVSTESCSSRDSNPRPFDHESGALTTELSPPPSCVYRLCVCVGGGGEGG